eukprot:644701-Pelagomonas_calceolata.AAC.2
MDGEHRALPALPRLVPLYLAEAVANPMLTICTQSSLNSGQSAKSSHGLHPGHKQGMRARKLTRWKNCRVTTPEVAPVHALKDNLRF